MQKILGLLGLSTQQSYKPFVGSFVSIYGGRLHVGSPNAHFPTKHLAINITLLPFAPRVAYPSEYFAVDAKYVPLPNSVPVRSPESLKSKF